MANTPNINLNLPANGSIGWDVPTNANWTTVDSAFGGTSVPKINPAILQVNGSTGLTGITGTGTSVVTNTSPTIVTPVISGILGGYNGLTPVGNGAPIVVALADLTGQNNTITTTTLFTTAASGPFQFRLSWNSKVTTAAGVSSTLGPLTISYTDPDSASITITTLALQTGGTTATSSTANSTSAAIIGWPLLLNCKASTAITYAMAYASNAANAMVYNLHIRLEAM